MVSRMCRSKPTVTLDGNSKAWDRNVSGGAKKCGTVTNLVVGRLVVVWVPQIVCRAQDLPGLLDGILRLARNKQAR